MSCGRGVGVCALVRLHLDHRRRRAARPEPPRPWAGRDHPDVHRVGERLTAELPPEYDGAGDPDELGRAVRLWRTLHTLAHTHMATCHVFYVCVCDSQMRLVYNCFAHAWRERQGSVLCQ